MRPRFRPAAIVFVLLTVTGCQTAPPPPPPELPPPPPVVREEAPQNRCADIATFYQEGVATYYAASHHGKKTASGEIFDMNSLTTAHRTLPMGTRIRVTNTENGRVVLVRVNDRGPYVRGRILDLSRRAATDLDFIKAGRARVRIETLASRC